MAEPRQSHPASETSLDEVRIATTYVVGAGNPFAKAYAIELQRQLLAREPLSMIRVQIGYVLANLRGASQKLMTAKLQLNQWAKAYDIEQHRLRRVA